MISYCLDKIWEKYGQRKQNRVETTIKMQPCSLNYYSNVS